MLMALLRDQAQRTGLSVTVESAGTAALDGEPASDHAVACMARRGLDISAHRSRHVSGLDATVFDLVLCMSSGHAAAMRSLGIPASRLSVVNADAGGVPDPYAGSMEDYEACALVLERFSRDLVIRLASSTH